MVRQLLGNIKGPKGNTGPKGDTGEQGVQGPPGTLENEAIGVVNKIDITNLDTRGTTSSYDYDIDSGVINYSDIEWYLSQDVVLNGVKHTFRVEDFLSNPDYYAGLLSLQIYDSDNSLAFSERVRPKTSVVVDLRGRDVQEYTVELRVTNSTLFSGFIEKPMLVEGDISVLWTPPSDSDFYLSSNLTGSIPYSGNLSEKEKITFFGSPEGWNSTTKEFLPPSGGTYLIVVNISPNTLSKGVVEVDIKNGNNVLTSVRGESPSTVTAIAYIKTVTVIPRINVEVSQSIRDENISLRGSNSSNVYIKKLLN